MMSDQADYYIAQLERVLAGHPVRNLDEAASAYHAALAAARLPERPDEGITDAMVEAVAEAIFHDDLKDEGGGTWESHDDGEKALYRSNARAALAAACPVVPGENPQA